MKSRGFTLVELLITIAVAAILLSIAYPSFTTVIRNNRLATTNNELLASVSLARMEAMRSRLGGGICTANEDATGCADSAEWGSNGWLVWVDSTAVPGFDQTVGDIAIKVGQPAPGLNTQVDFASGQIRFDSRGRPLPDPAGASWAVGIQPDDCEAGTKGLRRSLLVNAGGQIRSVRGDCQ